MTTRFSAVPSNPDWIREVTRSQSMQTHLISFWIEDLWDKIMQNVVCDGYYTGAQVAWRLETIKALSELREKGQKSGVFDTDNPYFRGAVRAYMFNYRFTHPIRTFREVRDLLRHKS